MSPIVNPIAVELDETARIMRIRWDDGHLGEWRWADLRRACPCALCAGEGNLPGIVTLETYLTPEQTTIERVKWIGRYALAPIWADGHDTGLFTYLRLRELCQCPEHAVAGAPSDAVAPSDAGGSAQSAGSGESGGSGESAQSAGSGASGGAGA